MQFMIPFATGAPVGLYEPKDPDPPVTPSPHNVLVTCELTGCKGVPAVPSMVEVQIILFLSFMTANMISGMGAFR